MGGKPVSKRGEGYARKRWFRATSLVKRDDCDTLTCVYHVTMVFGVTTDACVRANVHSVVVHFSVLDFWRLHGLFRDDEKIVRVVDCTTNTKYEGTIFVPSLL